MKRSRTTPSRGSSSKRFKPRSLSPTYESDGDEDVAINLFIVQAKLSAEDIAELMDLIEKCQSTSTNSTALFKLCSSPDDADVIVTEIRMRRRLERHVPWTLAKQKAIVVPQWVKDSIASHRPMPCGDYAAIQELHDETVHNCPDPGSCQQCQEEDQLRQSSDLPLSPPTTPPPAPASGFKDADKVKSNLSYRSRYACKRASPMICVNQALAEEIDILRRARELEGENMSALAYERAVAIIKAYPYVVDMKRLHDEVAKLPGIGQKLLAKIEEFLTSGKISEARDTLASPRFQTLSEFNTIYGIGPVTARQLYDRGLRTLEHLEAFYDIHDAGLKDETNPNTNLKLSAKGAPEVTIKVGLTMRHDLNVKIPRAEVEEMHRVVMKELACIQEGCISTIVGGHSDWKGGGEKIKGLCKKLVTHLYSKGLVTHVMHLSSFRPHNALRTGHWDSLEKALTIFRLPPAGSQKRIHRRLDLIFASPEAYWTAVTGWTGSKTFERDLRLWAKEQKGFKFDSTGITRRHDSKLFYPKSEKEVFNILGLEWVDPTLRNAGV